MLRTIEVSLLYKTNCILAEGSRWHAARKSFFWVDIEGRAIFEYGWQSKNVRKWQLAHRVSLIIEDKRADIIVALQGGIARFNLDTGSLSLLTAIEQDKPFNRTNDGACDSNGRIWIGTMELECKDKAGALYCIENGVPIQKINQLTIPNGMVWAPDNKRLYHIDSPDFSVVAYSYDPSGAVIEKQGTIISIDKSLGMPDGMTIDAEGMLWIAHWGGFGITRWDPNNGKMLTRIPLPVPNVTSCTFGGDRLEQLFITTARQHLSEKELAGFPDSGSIYIVEPGVSGMEANKFAE